MARLLARRLNAGATHVVDLAAVGPVVHDPEHALARHAEQAVRDASVAVIASPVHGGVHTELLRAFLRRLRGRGLDRMVAVPMLVTSPHSYDHVGDTLRPVLVGLGATCPTPSLVLRESDVGRLGNTGATLRTWADRHAQTLRDATRGDASEPTDTVMPPLR